MNEKKWTQDIKTKYHPPVGTFLKSPKEIAKIIAKDSKDLKQAVDRVVFYYNRKGDEDKKREEVIKELHKIYGVNEEHTKLSFKEYIFEKLQKDK